MITKSLIKPLEEIGFNYFEAKSNDKSHAYAIYNGYLTSVYEKNNKKILYINFKLSENEENALKKYNVSEIFSSQLESFSVLDYSIEEDGMRVYSTADTDTFISLIDCCINLIAENNIKGVKQCSECGNGFGSRHPKKVTVGCEDHLMCEHCAIDAIEKANERAVEKSVLESKEKTWKGVLGAIGFSVIGILIYFVLYNWVSPAVNSNGLNEIRYIFCAVGFLVALLAYNGYRIFCKKISLAAYITIPVASMICTAIGQYIGVVFEFVAGKNFIAPLSNKAFWLVHLRSTIPADQVEFFTDYSATFYKLLAISLMFTLVGAAIFLLTLHDKSSVKAEAPIIETIPIK